ncbi:MAG TPA: deoxyribonuclease IV [Gaiellaceae bacterium]|nr:deoxyribonuclease IV [Gaiellaceae bacterium]
MIFGGHCSGGVKKALDHAIGIGADAVQLFVQSPRTWRFPDHDPAELRRFCERREENAIRSVLVHALYLVNLASPNDDFYGKSVSALRSTVDAACKLDADAVIFHVGSHQGAGLEPAMTRIVAAIEQVLDRCSDTTWLLMENSAGAGGTIGRSIDELALLFDALGRHPRLGICLDTCHLFVSGYDVRDREVLDLVLEQVDLLIGLDRLRALHVNDSKAPLGSNRDRHENVGDGLIGERLGVFLSHPALQGLPAVCEVPGTDGNGPDAEQMERLRAIHARWTSPRGRAHARTT